MKKQMKCILLFLILFILLPQTVFAEKGEFYEKYQNDFDKAPLSEEYIDIVKTYDSDTNSFECGKFEISCKVTSMPIVWATGLAKFVSEGMEFIVLEPSMITEDPAFIKYKNYFKDLSNGMLVLFMVWQIMMIVIRRFGDPDDYPQAMSQKIILVIAAAIFLGLYENIFSYILTIQQSVTSAILTSGVTEDQLILMVLLYSSVYSIFFALCIGIINIIFLIALIYRFVALGFFYAVGPVAIPTMLNDEFNYFQIWLRYIVNNIVTLFVQSIAFVMSVSAMTGQFKATQSLPYGVDIIAGFLLSIVFCFFALVLPGVLGNLGSSTGTGRAIGRVVRFAVTKR
jgi:hypothetical protein